MCRQVSVLSSPSAFPTTEKHLSSTPLAKPPAASRQGLSDPSPPPVVPLQPPPLTSIPGNRRDGDEGCCFWLPDPWASWESGPRPAASLAHPAHPCAGSEHMLLSSPWLLERKGFGEEEEKGGNRAGKTTPGFLHPEETSWTHTRETTSLLNSCYASCKNYLKCQRTLWLQDPVLNRVLRNLPRAVAPVSSGGNSWRRLQRGPQGGRAAGVDVAGGEAGEVTLQAWLWTPAGPLPRCQSPWQQRPRCSQPVGLVSSVGWWQHKSVGESWPVGKEKWEFSSLLSNPESDVASQLGLGPGFLVYELL